MKVEELIHLVRDRPCLYDTRDPRYRDILEKHRSWTEIANILDVPYKTVKSRWRNLKDTYAKYLKSKFPNPGQSTTSKYGNWQWAIPMEFMKQHLNIPSTVTHSTMDEFEAPSQFNDKASTEDPFIKTQAFLVVTPKAVSQSRVGTPALSQRQQKRQYAHEASPERNTLTNTDKIPSENTHKNLQYKDLNNYEGIDLIFLGYAKTVKTFSTRRQAEVKLKIAKIMMEEEIAQYEETYSEESPFPSSNFEDVDVIIKEEQDQLN